MDRLLREEGCHHSRLLDCNKPRFSLAQLHVGPNLKTVHINASWDSSVWPYSLVCAAKVLRVLVHSKSQYLTNNSFRVKVVTAVCLSGAKACESLQSARRLMMILLCLVGYEPRTKVAASPPKMSGTVSTILNQFKALSISF